MGKQLNTNIDIDNLIPTPHAICKLVEHPSRAPYPTNYSQ